MNSDKMTAVAGSPVISLLGLKVKVFQPWHGLGTLGIAVTAPLSYLATTAHVLTATAAPSSNCTRADLFTTKLLKRYLTYNDRESKLD